MPSARLSWRDGAEPPDFALFIDDVEYAVEVTELRKLFKVGQAQLPLKVIGRELEAFVQRVECALLSSSGFEGEYAIVIPRPIPDLRTREPQLIGIIDAAMVALRTLPPNAKVPIFRAGGRQCSLLKLTADGCSLVLFGPTHSQWGEESRVEISEVINQHIRVKATTLRNITVPRLLVLDDRHLYSEGEHFSHLLCNAPERELFHTVFVARGERADVILTSQFLGATGGWDSRETL